MTDLLKITVDSSDVARAQQDIKGLRKSTLDLEKSLKPLIRREKEFKRAVSAVNDAVRLGVANQRQANIALRDLAKQYGFTTKQVQRMNLALVQNTRSFKRFGSVGLQQVGYQVGDFAVQLQGGTNAFVAFGQQGSQLLGIFGPMGAIAGAVLAIFTAFAAPLSQMETGTGAAADEMAKLKGELEPIATMVRNLGSSLKVLAINSINAIANNLQKVISYAAAFTALWIGRLGIVYGIKAATWAMSTFGSVGAATFALLKRAMIATGFLAFGVLLGEIVNKMLQVREATGSWGATFKLVSDLVGAVLDDAAALFENIGISITNAGLRARANFQDMLAGMFDSTHDFLNKFLAAFKTVWKGITNAGKTALNGVIESFNTLLDAIYRGIDNLFGKIASLPGAAQIGITGTNLADSGFKADLIPIDATSNQSILADVIAERGATSKTADRMRGSSNSLRTQADELATFKRETDATQAAWEALSATWESADTAGQAFDLEALLAAMQEAGEATSETTEQLDKQVEAWKAWQEGINNALNSTEEQIRQKISLIGLSKEEAELAQFIYDLEKKMGATRSQLNAEQQQQYDTILALKEEYIQKTEAQVAANERLKQAEEKVQAVSKSLASETVGALKSIVNGTKTASEAFRDMALNIIQQIMDILIWQPLITSLTNSISGSISGAQSGGGALGGIVSSIFGFQKGGAFSAGNVVPFAYGGVVNSPTMFGMSGGRTGLMGEAGPEAIMPLKRGAGGKLGVEGGGNVTVHQTFNFSANGDESVKKIIAQAAPKIAQMTEAKIINSRQRGGQMRRAFG
jgi:hypothetical protein